MKAQSINPQSNFKVSPYNDFHLVNDFNPDIIIMPEITWYVLDSLDNFLHKLKEFAKNRSKPTFLIHLLSTYATNVQKYGNDKFTNDFEISRGTYFIARIG